MQREVLAPCDAAAAAAFGAEGGITGTQNGRVCVALYRRGVSALCVQVWQEMRQELLLHRGGGSGVVV